MEIDKLADLVMNHYHNRNFQRGPYGSDAALNEARAADETSTQRIIVDESESAWHAYYTASKAISSTHGFQGKADLGRLLRALETQPVQQQRSFAQQLANKLSNRALQPTDNSENGESQRPHKRRCMYALLLSFSHA
jgi:hypothetical protein